MSHFYEVKGWSCPLQLSPATVWPSASQPKAIVDGFDDGLPNGSPVNGLRPVEAPLGDAAKLPWCGKPEVAPCAIGGGGSAICDAYEEGSPAIG